MSFLTTNPSPFILNQPELTNVVTSASGGSSALCNAIADILSVIDTTNATLSANSLGSFTANAITVTTTLNLSNSAIYINGSNTLSSNVLNGNPYMAIQALGLEKARFTVNGVGINTINPRADLDITGATAMRGNLFISTVSVFDPIGSIYFNGFQTLTYNNLNGNSSFIFSLNSTNHTVLTSNGVGILTNSPISALDVNGSAVIRGDLYVSSGGHLYVEDGIELTASTINGAPYLAFETTGSEMVRITSNGTGFNTVDPKAIIDVEGESIFRSNLYISTSGTLTIDKTNVLSASTLNGYPHLSFEVNGSEKMRLVSNSIGVGTSNPIAVFDIRGDTLIGGSLYVSSLGASITSSLGYIYADGDIFARSMFSMSDSNLKYNVSEYRPSVLPTPVEFKWKATDNRDIGVIAQEMERIEPACVKVTPAGIKAVDYSKLVVLCLAEIRALRQELDMLRSKINNP